MDNICIAIPARYASARFHGKLLSVLGDKTCIERTYLQCKKSQYADAIYILTDEQKIKDKLLSLDSNAKVIIANKPCINGTDRISKHLEYIPEKYKYIVNVQADEPFIDPRNIDRAIERHIEAMISNTGRNAKDIFYTTLHCESDEYDYVQDRSSVKVVTDLRNNVLLYSRNVIPTNKQGKINKNIKYKLFTGIYVFNREYLEKYAILDDTPLQLEEDVEQLKVLEHGYTIKSFKAPYYNEVSLNTKKDYKHLLDKYINKKKIEEINKKKKIKFAVFDLDGVFTDGKIYIMENTHFKCYNGKDAYGLKVLQNNKIITGLITAHDTPVLSNMEHIIPRMDYVSAGNYNKLEVLEKWVKQENVDWSEVSYIGDDLSDIPVLKKVGLSASPKNAIPEVLDVVDYVCEKIGGDGAVREFVNVIMNH